MYNSNYTKISNDMLEDSRFNLADCVIYAKLIYRMKLSIKSDKFFDNGYYVIYKINDLSHDCGVSRNVVINSLKKLSKLGYVCKDRKIFGLRLYLPKFKTTRKPSRKKTCESHESKLTSENKNHRINNNNNNNYVYGYTCSSVKKAKSNHKKVFPKLNQIIKRFGKPLVDYSFKIYHRELDKDNHVHNALHFIYGILRRWKRKGIKTVNDAMKSEHDKHYVSPQVANGPAIPIFQIK